MSKTVNRRRNKALKRIKQMTPQELKSWMAQLLDQWACCADFRAAHLRDRAGNDAPKAWDLFKNKLPLATALGIEDDLIEFCRQAVARQMGNGNTYLKPSRHLRFRNHAESLF